MYANETVIIMTKYIFWDKIGKWLLISIGKDKGLALVNTRGDKRLSKPMMTCFISTYRCFSVRLQELHR